MLGFSTSDIRILCVRDGCNIDNYLRLRSYPLCSSIEDLNPELLKTTEKRGAEKCSVSLK